MARRPQKHFNVQAPDEGFVIVPYYFVVNGTSDADGLSDSLESAVFSEAGEYLCTLRDKYPECYGGTPPNISNTADDVDLYGKVDTSTVVSASTFVVRCMTAATETTPTDDTVVSGLLFVKKNTRHARG